MGYRIKMYQYRAFVKRVYDGDTITVDIDLGFNMVMRNQKIRLSRINTPEIRGASREAGLKSKLALEEKILNKNIVIHTQKDKKGKYGRWLAEIWLADVCLNDWLLSEGLAEKY